MEWQPISRETIKQWRRRLPRGWRREDSAFRNPYLTPIDHDGDNVDIETQRPLGHLEGRETVERSMADILTWAQTASKERLIEWIKNIQETTGFMKGMPPEDAARDLRGLAEKLARESAERVYRKQGWDKPITDLTVDGKQVTV